MQSLGATLAIAAHGLAPARFLLAPEDGFEPPHTYLVRVVQVKSTSERILAEGDIHLE